MSSNCAKETRRTSLWFSIGRISRANIFDFRTFSKFETSPRGSPPWGDRSTVGTPTVGKSTVGMPTVGNSTVGMSTVGASTVGNATVGMSTVGKPIAGRSTVRRGAHRREIHRRETHRREIHRREVFSGNRLLGQSLSLGITFSANIAHRFGPLRSPHLRCMPRREHCSPFRLATLAASA